jgi:hypothetical protein
MIDRVADNGRGSWSNGSQESLPGRHRGRQEFAAPSIDWRRTLLWILAAKLYGLLILYVIFLRTELQPGEKGFIFMKRGQDRAERVREIESGFVERLSPYDGQFYRDIAILLPILWRRLPLSLAAYGTAAVVLPLLTGVLLSFGRFLSVSVPHFLALALFLQAMPLARGVLVTSMVLLQILLASGLIAWHLVG